MTENPKPETPVKKEEKAKVATLKVTVLSEDENTLQFDTGLQNERGEKMVVVVSKSLVK